MVDEGRQFELMKLDYDRAREDLASDLGLFGAIIGAALVLLSVFSGYLLQNAEAQAIAGDHGVYVATLIAIVIPLIPGGLLAYAVSISTRVVLRSYYMRELEIELTQGQPHSPTAPSEMTFPRWAHLEIEASGHRYSSRSLRLSWYLIYSVLFFLVIGTSVLSILVIPPDRLDLRILSSIVISLALVPPTYVAFRNGFAGRRVWHRALHNTNKRVQDTIDGFIDDATEVSGDSRSFLSYLIVPRIADHIGKLAIPGIALAIGSIWLSGWRHTLSLSSFGAGLAAILVFEYLFYQGRYMINDLRDMEVDAEDPLDRGRIPEPVDAQRAITCIVVAVGRISLALLLAWFVLPGALGRGVFWACFAALLAAVPYEALRARSNEIGRSDELEPTNRYPEPVKRSLTTKLVLLVGSGYSIRACMGLYIGANADMPILVLVCFAAAMWAAEASNVAMAWILEGSAHVGRDGSWYARSLLRKAHVADLTNRAGVVRTNRLGADHEGATPRKLSAASLEELIKDGETRATVPVLMREPLACGPRPWTVAASIALAFGALAGVALARSDLGSTGANMALVAAAVCSAAIAMTPMVSRPESGSRFVNFFRRLISGEWSIALAGLLVAIFASAAADSHQWIWAAAVPVLIAVLLQGTRMANYEGFVGWVRSLVEDVGAASIRGTATIANVVVGEAAATAIGLVKPASEGTAHAGSKNPS